MQTVDDFVEKILVDKGITDMDPETRQEVKEQMKTELLHQIDRAAINQLSDEKATELDKLLDDPNFSNEQMTEFMQQAGVDLTQIALDTMMKFRGLYLGTEG